MEANMDTQLVKAVTVEMATGREMQEVKAMVFMAKQYPRDEEQALAKILKACERKSLAEQATYEFPRGDQKVTGPSIRLAEAIAQSWGNIDFGITELEQRDGESVVMARAWDLETNTRESKVFTVPHTRATKRGNYRLTDPRDIYEIVANLGARRLRSCILGIIPGDVIEAAVEKCQETLSKNLGGKLDEVIARMVAAFGKDYKVTKAMLEAYIGCNIEAFSARDIIRLKNVFTSLKDGMGKPSDYFEDMPPEKPAQGATGNTKLDGELKKKQGAENASAQ